MIWNLKVIQIEGQLQFIELEHAVLLLWIEWRIMSVVKWSIFDESDRNGDRYSSLSKGIVLRIGNS